MDLKQSVAHLKDMEQKAGGLGHPISEVWNDWAKELMDERGWDEERQNYLKPSTPEWEQKAKLIYRPYGFQLNVSSPNEQIKILKSGVHFKDCIFPGEVTFQPGPYKHLMNFEGARFLEGAEFEGCQFENNANFSYVKSYRYLNFSDAKFKGKADFGSLEILNNNSSSSFAHVAFDKIATFNQSFFESNVDFSGCKFYDITDFSLARFDGEANFSAIISERSFILVNTEFVGPPDFTSYRMDHLPYINGISVDKLSEKQLWSKRYDLDHEIKKLQSLKALAIQAHDHEMETYFFAEEMRCKYLELKSNDVTKTELVTNVLNRIPYIVYKNLSDYGLSIIKPFVWWVALIIAMMLLYSKLSIGKISSALYLSILHSLPVFGLFKTENQKLATGILGHECRWWDLIYISQNIFASLLVFLLFQAIRNRFKIK